MKLLSVGTDERVFVEGSAARVRQKAYAERIGEVHCIVPTRRKSRATIDGPLSLHPVSSRLSIPFTVRRLLAETDAVTTQDPFETGLLALIGMWGRRVPLHVQVHTDFLAPEFSQLSFINRIRVLIAPFVLRRATRIRVVSERIRDSILARYRLTMPITVLPIYVDTARFRTAAVPPELTARFGGFKTKLLVVSRLEAEKNVRLAIRSLAEATDPDTCLIIVGSGREERRLHEKAARCGVPTRVFFEGEKDPAEYYKLSDLVLVPSRYEGYGLVIIEALAAGTPVLSTDVGVARESGAIVAKEEEFAAALADWMKGGERQGRLEKYPYASFDEYVAAYSADITACASDEKGQ